MKPHTEPMIQTISSSQRHSLSLRRCLAIALFLTIIACLQPIQAQPKYGISAITTVTPPYPITLDGFVAEGGTKLALQIIPTDVTIAQYPVLLKLVISGNGITLESRTLTIHEPVYLNGKEITRLDGNDLQAFFNPDNLNFNGYSKTQYQRNGRLPEGVYTVGFELYDVLRKIQVASVKSTLVFLFLNEVPSLNLPLSGDLISAAGTQVVNFRWSTRHSPLAATFFTPQYLFEMWDIQPEGMNPYEVVRGTRPVYATTVSSTYLSYGIAEPPLLPGHTYAWRVRETDPDGKTLFKNNGYTEVYTFKYGINCPAPELKADKAGTSNLSVWWQANPEENKFELRYRDKKKKNPEWYTQSVNTLSSKVENLKSNTVYEIEVCAICGDQRSEYSNRVEMNTRQNTSFKCGQIDSSKLPQNQNPLRKLSSGDVFKAFGFDVEVKEASGSGGTFTGKGYVLVPLLNFIKIEAKFDNARINEDYQLIGGEVKTVYNLKNSLTYIPGQGIAGLSDLTDLAKLIAGDKEKNQFDDLADKKIEVDSVKDIKIEGNKIIVTDANGKTEEVPLSAGKVVSIKTDEGKEYVVDTNSGTIYSSGNSGQKAASGAPSGPVTTAALAGKGSPKYNVSFIPHKLQEYGFDYPTDKSPKDNYEQVSLIESPILVPWKSLEAGHIERTVAEIAGGPADSVRYYRQSNNVVMTAPGEKATQKQIMLNGNGKNDEDKLFAWYAAYTQADSGKTYARVLAGQLNLISYEKKSIKVVLVPVNNASCPNPDYVKTELNKIYKPAVVEWDVALGNNLKVTFPSGTVFDNTDPNDRMDYTDDMKAAISALKEDAQYNGETYYLFFLDNAKDLNTKGYMPLKQQFGFIFKYKQYPDEYLRTIAHELGHGPFRLWHTFSKSNKYIQPQGTTDNLMDYANASALKLNKYQWDWMHDPEWRLYWFTEEDEGALDNPFSSYIKAKLKEFETNTGYKYFAVIHCDVCQTENSSNTTIPLAQYKFSEVLTAPTNYIGFAKDGQVNQITKSDAKVVKIQLVEKGKGKCLLLYYQHGAKLPIEIGENSPPNLQDEISKKLFFSDGLVETNCTSSLGDWSQSLCELNAANVFTNENSVVNYYNNLFSTINNCLLNNSSQGSSSLSLNEIQDLLLELKSQARSNQRYQFEQQGFIYELNDQNLVETKASPETNEDINAGNWSDNGIDMKMRLAYGPDEILQFVALGIRKDLPLNGKKATLTEISKNMLDKNNALLKINKVKSVTVTPANLNVELGSKDGEEFVDGKKVEIDKDASFFKILSEACGIGISFLKTSEIEKPVYLDQTNSAIKAPPIATGTLEVVGSVVTDITSAVSTVHDIITDEKARKEAKDGFIAIKNQVVSDPVQLFPILGEVALQEFTGSSSENFSEMNDEKANKGRKNHLITKTSIKTVTSVFASGKFIAKLPEMAEEVALKMANAKSFLRFKHLKDISEDLLKNFEDKLKSLEDGGKKFLDDFKDAADGDLKTIVNNREFIDNWKSLDELDVDASVRKSIEAVTDPGALEDALEVVPKAKPTWPELQALFKRGNDFNGKRKFDYPYSEIWLEHPSKVYPKGHKNAGKPRRFRLDSYDNVGEGKIVSRKATTLSEIQTSTFENYLKELAEKYPEGSKIANSNIGTQLKGKFYLEIPETNKAFFNNSKELQKLAKDYKVTIVFKPE